MKRNLIILSAALLVLGLSIPASARLMKDNAVPANEVNMQPYTNTTATLTLTCDEGGSTSGSSIATAQSQIKTCTCYTTTGGTKVGAIKININGVDRWLRTYDNAN